VSLGVGTLVILDDADFSGVISGSGRLILGPDQDDTSVLSGQNIYTGQTDALGTLVIANNQALGFSSVNLAGVLRAGVPGLTIGNEVLLANDATVDTQGFTLTLTQGVGVSQFSTPDPSFTKIGAGTLI